MMNQNCDVWIALVTGDIHVINIQNSGIVYALAKKILLGQQIDPQKIFQLPAG